MSIFEVTPNSLKELKRTDFASQGLRERGCPTQQFGLA